MTYHIQARAPLSRQRVLHAALALADAGGIESLTMRKLGHTLGIEAMSLYNHVSSKDDLLNGLIDLVFAEVDLPCDDCEWKTAMRQRAISVREALLRHRWAIGLMESRARPGPANLRHHEAVLRTLRKAGFTLEAAGHAYSVLDSYIYGFSLNEKSLPFESSEEVVELGRRWLAELPVSEYPNLLEFLTGQAMQPGYSYANEFELGLDLILDGLERWTRHQRL